MANYDPIRGYPAMMAAGKKAQAFDTLTEAEFAASLVQVAGIPAHASIMHVRALLLPLSSSHLTPDPPNKLVGGSEKFGNSLLTGVV